MSNSQCSHGLWIERKAFFSENLYQLECGPMPNVMVALLERRWRPLFNVANFG